jgi:hypothetical protein
MSFPRARLLTGLVKSPGLPPAALETRPPGGLFHSRSLRARQEARPSEENETPLDNGPSCIAPFGDSEVYSAAFLAILFCKRPLGILTRSVSEAAEP